MHEYPLTQQIIRIAETYALENRAARVTRIRLVIGEAAGIVADSILLYFDLIAEGTLCENAQISIETVKPMLRCKACGALFLRKPFSFQCTEEGCAGQGEPTDIGREFTVKSIEIEKE